MPTSPSPLAMVDSDSSTRGSPWPPPPPTDPFSINPTHHSSLPAPVFHVYPGQSHSLAGIAARAGCLGFTMGTSLVLSLITGCFQLPFFIFILSSFHFAEFWTTARYNTPNAKTKGIISPPLRAVTYTLINYRLQPFSSPRMVPPTLLLT